MFVQSKSELLPGSYSQLGMLYQYLSNHPESKIELSGHTDNRRNARLNQILSENRVITIRDYLIERGISKNRITGQGYDGSRPIASNAQE